MAPRPRRTTAEKAEAVGLAEVIGIRPAADVVGIPESTLRRWREAPDMAQLRAEKKEEVTADVWAAFQVGVRRIAELLPTTTDLGKVAIATGVIYDKYALMSGEATTRSESRALTEGLNDHERATLRDIIDAALEGADAPAPEHPVGAGSELRQRSPA